jgi:hypothetical protein
MVDDQEYVDIAFFTDNDSCTNILKFGTTYAEHSVLFCTVFA